MPGLDKETAAALTHTLRQTLRENVFLTSEQLALSLSGSFGLATFPEDGDTVHTMLRSADSMMYEVKNTTRDDVAIMGVPRRRLRSSVVADIREGVPRLAAVSQQG